MMAPCYTNRTAIATDFLAFLSRFVDLGRSILLQGSQQLPAKIIAPGPSPMVQQQNAVPSAFRIGSILPLKPSQFSSKLITPLPAPADRDLII